MSAPVPVVLPPASPMRPLPHLSHHAWVDAAPFRAHLRRLIDATGEPWFVVVQAAGLSVRHGQALLHGRDGRRPRRVSGSVARGILATTPEGVVSLRTRMLQAGDTLEELTTLVGEGVSVASLAAFLGLTEQQVIALAEWRVPDSARVSATFQLRVSAAREVLDERTFRAATHAA